MVVSVCSDSLKAISCLGLTMAFLMVVFGFQMPGGVGDRSIDKGGKKKKVTIEAPYTARLTDIVHRFQDEVYEVEKCRVLMEEASGLAREVNKFMRATPTLNQEEKEVLTKLAKDAAGVKYAIEALRDTGWTITPIAKFERGCDVLGADLDYIKKDQYCVYIIQVTVNELAAHLLENPSANGNMIRYSWKKAYEIGGGIVNLALYGESVNRIFDNESKPERYPAEVFNLVCAGFPE